MARRARRYAYKVDILSGGDKEKAEGAIFAAARLNIPSFFLLNFGKFYVIIISFQSYIISMFYVCW